MKILKREFVAPMFMASIGVFFLGFIWIMNLYLKEGDYIEIFGEVEEYNGGKEVIGSKVVLK